MFQRDTSDIDQALFAMYVQEYDEHSDGSNKRMAYIAYLDSVSYMRPSEYILLHRVTSCYIVLHLVTSCYIVLLCLPLLVLLVLLASYVQSC